MTYGDTQTLELAGGASFVLAKEYFAGASLLAYSRETIAPAIKQNMLGTAIVSSQGINRFKLSYDLVMLYEASFDLLDLLYASIANKEARITVKDRRLLLTEESSTRLRAKIGLAIGQAFYPKFSTVCTKEPVVSFWGGDYASIQFELQEAELLGPAFDE